MLRLADPTVAARTLRRYHNEYLPVQATKYEQQHPRVSAPPPARGYVTIREPTLSTLCSLPSRPPTISPMPSGRSTLASLNKPLPALPREAAQRPWPSVSATHMKLPASELGVGSSLRSGPVLRPSSAELAEYYTKLQEGPGERRRRKTRERRNWKERMKKAGQRVMVAMAVCGHDGGDR